MFSSHSTPLSVHLSCPENRQVVFQLHNENLREGDEADEDPDNWNQLFNEARGTDIPPALPLPSYLPTFTVLCRSTWWILS